MLAAAGRSAEARVAASRAAAEVDAKAKRLRDPELRKHFLESRARTV